MMKQQPRRSNSCFVETCSSQYGQNEKLTMFCVPKDKNLREKWSKALHRTDKKLSTNDVVCEKHFYKNDIIRFWTSGQVSVPYTRPKLRQGVVPIVSSAIEKNANLATSQLAVSSQTSDSALFSNEMCVKVNNFAVCVKAPEINKYMIKSDESTKYVKINRHFDSGTVRAKSAGIGCNITSITPEDLFDELFNKNVQLLLPPVNWGCVSTTNERAERLILITEAVIKNGVSVIRRQIIISENLNVSYAFGANRLSSVVLRDEFNLPSWVNALEELQCILDSFYGLKICNGGPTIRQFCQSDLKSNIAKVDTVVKRWRHVKCPFFYTVAQRSCKYCRTLHTSFYRSAKIGLIRKLQMAAQLSPNCQMRNKILKNSDFIIGSAKVNSEISKTALVRKFREEKRLNMQLQVRIKYLIQTVRSLKLTLNCQMRSKVSNYSDFKNDIAKISPDLGKSVPWHTFREEKRLNIRLQNRIKHLSQTVKSLKLNQKQTKETVFSEDLAKVKLPPAQMLLIKECLRLSRYKVESSRRYSSEWVFFCMLLFSTSKEVYNLFGVFKILPLCDVNTVKRNLNALNGRNSEIDLMAEFKERIEAKFDSSGEIYALSREENTSVAERCELAIVKGASGKEFFDLIKQRQLVQNENQLLEEKAELSKENADSFKNENPTELSEERHEVARTKKVEFPGKGNSADESNLSGCLFLPDQTVSHFLNESVVDLLEFSEMPEIIEKMETTQEQTVEKIPIVEDDPQIFLQFHEIANKFIYCASDEAIP